MTHPYLILSYEQVIGSRSVSDPATETRVESLRAAICVQLGLCNSPEEAGAVSAAVPRVVLVHEPPHPAKDQRVTAVSMGQFILSVPVTAALAIASAGVMGGTIVPARPDVAHGELVVVGPTSSVTAKAIVDGEGRVSSAAVQRTARIMMRGRISV